MSLIEIVSPPRQGGPFNWASKLARYANKSPEFQARHIYKYPDIVARQLYTTSDLIHAAFPYPFRPSGKPYILTIKGDFNIENKIIAQLYYLAIRHADTITVPSEYLKRRLHLHNAIVIPNAVDLSPNLYRSRNEAVTNLLTVTNLWFPEKARGVKTLIDIVNRLVDGGQNIKLTILGEGQYKNSLISYANQRARFPINFTGWQDPKKFYSQTDIFVYYSYHDNMPNSVLEALAAGLPIVSNNVGATPEILLNNAGLIANSQRQYKDLLLSLVKSEADRRELSQNAYKTAKQNFSWSMIINRYLDLYRQLL